MDYRPHCSTHTDQVTAIKEQGMAIHEIELRMSEYFAANDQKLESIQNDISKLCIAIDKIHTRLDQLLADDSIKLSDVVKQGILVLIGVGAGVMIGMF